MVPDWYRKLLCGVPFGDQPLPSDERTRALFLEAQWLIRNEDTLCCELADDLGLEYAVARENGWFAYAVLAELLIRRR